MKPLLILGRIVLVWLLLAHHARADVRLPKTIGSNMVWQRDRPTRVWGWADPGEAVTVTFAGQRVQTKTDSAGQWSVTLNPLRAGGPHTMRVRGHNLLTLENILIGDVWVCSGQSNMELAMRHTEGAERAIAGANYPAIRLFTTSHQMSTTPLTDLRDGNWSVCRPDCVANFSAVAYYFGKELHEKEHVPIGLIHSSWGGTVIEAWISGPALRTVEGFAPAIDQLPAFALEKSVAKGEEAFQQWKKTIPQLDRGLVNGKPIWADPLHDTSGWDTMQLPQNWDFAGYQRVDGAVWFRRTFTLPDSVARRGITVSLGPIDEADETFVNGQKIGETLHSNLINRHYAVPPSLLETDTNVLVVRVEDYKGRGGVYGKPDQMIIESGPFRSSLAGPWRVKIGTPDLPPSPRRTGPNSQPTMLYNAMIHPLLPTQIKGVIWYQGESNEGRASQYRTLFPLLIQDWRQQWGQVTGQPGAFPFLFVQLAAYRPALSQPAGGDWAKLREAQTSALALPNTGMAVTIDIGDAHDIHPRNKRDVGHRLSVIARYIAYGENVVYSGPMYKAMSRAGNQLRLTFDHIGAGLTIYGQPLRGFAIAGSDKQFVWADAVIENNSVLVSSPLVSNPVAVRYAWADNPAGANLFNRDGLPASPFRTDTGSAISNPNK